MMSKTKWTEMQTKAIYTEGKNILVSAGAGSGKTAVLTERIVEKLKKGISVQNLIVLTFTNASAFEMKERVRNKLIDEIKNGNDLKKELEALDDASICTFDSFSLSLVKKYHYLLNLNKEISIAPSSILKLEKEKILDEIFNNLYEENDSKFLNLLDKFTMKDDKKIKTALLSIDSKLDVLANKEKYLEEYLNNYYNDNFIDKNINKYVTILKEKVEYLNNYLFELENVCTGELYPWYQKVYDSLNFLEKVDSYEDIALIRNVTLPTVTRSKKIDEESLEEVKEVYKKLKDSVTELKKLCLYQDSTKMKNIILETKEDVSVFILILKLLNKKIMDFKIENNVFEFSDIGRFAIKLLEENSEIKDYYVNNINEIMIDEYQDTNDIGEYFVSLISNNNVYMVGDVKQSIYGFRNANPKIFMEKYDKYKGDIGIKIDLMQNFRSRSEVLDAVNLIFEDLMSKEIGGADYLDGHQMVFGNKTYDVNKNKLSQDMEILDYHFEKGKFKKEEIEAFLIAYDIEKKIKEGFTVLDKETGVMRPLTYKDIVILMDRKTNFDLYKKIFTYKKIPTILYKEEKYEGSYEIFVIKNILLMILCIKDFSYYNDYFEHAFLSVARSFLFKYSDEDIMILFNKSKNENTSLYNELKKDEKFKDLYLKINEVLNKESYLPIHLLVNEIYNIFEFYKHINETNLVEVKNYKILNTLKSLELLANMGYDLKDVIDYFDEILSKESKETFKLPVNSKSAVSLMSIHTSKGLEFPLCYYSGLYKNFNADEEKERFLYHKNYGIVVPVFDEGITNTFYKELIKYENHKEDVGEKIRLFYVALTRAKEKLVLVTSLCDSKTNLSTVKETDKLNFKNFYNMLEAIKGKLMPYVKHIDLENINLDNSYITSKEKLDLNKLIKSEIKIKETRLNIDKEIIKENHFSTSPLIITKDVRDKMKLGNKIHEYLEYIDFKNRKEEYKKYNISEFYINKIEKLFTCEFMHDIDKANIYKEYEFVYDENNIKKHGIIDLLLELDDKFIIVDYKLKDINKKEYLNQVKGYIDYIKTISDKKIDGYIYSIIDEKYIKV